MDLMTLRGAKHAAPMIVRAEIEGMETALTSLAIIAATTMPAEPSTICHKPAHAFPEYAMSWTAVDGPQALLRKKMKAFQLEMASPETLETLAVRWSLW